MNWLRLLLCCWLVFSDAAFALGISQGPPSVDTLPFVCSAPVIELHPTAPDLAFGLCANNGPGTSEITIEPGEILDFTGTFYDFPADASCTGASPNLGNMWLEPSGGSFKRGWLTASGCDRVIPFQPAGSETILFEGNSQTSFSTEGTIAGDYFQYSSGGEPAISSFDLNFTSDVVRVGNRILVTMSNIAAAGSNPVMNPGVVLLFDIDDSGATPLVSTAAPAFIVTSDPNPTAVTALPGGLAAVTNTGLHDVGVPPLLTGAGSIDVIDPVAATVIASIPISDGNPGSRKLALDPTGSVAVVGSNTFKHLYAIDIRGLGDLPRPSMDPTLQRPSCHVGDPSSSGPVPCLRERVIRGFVSPIAPNGVAANGFIVDLRFGLSGDFVVATSFNDLSLVTVAFDTRNLDVLHPLLASRFGAPESLAVPSGLQPGPMVIHGNSASGAAGSDVLWFDLVGTLHRGTLSGSLASPTGDADGDGTEDALDLCPWVTNSALDADADGIGNDCQCGDVEGDGSLQASDADQLQGFLAGANLLIAPEKCNVHGLKDGEGGTCDILDWVYLRRRLANQLTSVQQRCAAALP